MSLENLLMMRHEILLTIAALLVLSAEIFTGDNGKKHLSIFSVILFALITAAGFLPVKSGILFGGMYVSSPVTVLMKNIINIGALIVFIQSVSWLGKEENTSSFSSPRWPV